MTLRKEITGSLALLLFGLGFLLYDIKYPLDQWENPGPGVFPLMVGTVLVILSAIPLAQSLRKLKRHDSEKEKKGIESQSLEGLRGERNVLYMILIFILYLLMVKWVGFFTSNLIFVVISSRLMGSKDWKGPIILSMGVNLFCYVLFEIWLKVAFPRGILL